MRRKPVRRNPELRPSPYGKNLAGRELTGQDLSHMDLTGANLHGAFLLGAELSFTSLHGANLGNAYLSGALAENADLREADLRNADLNRVTLTDANLGGADLSYAKLTNVVLNGANLRGANLTRATLFSARLVSANLSDATLTGADLRGGAILIGANLSGANLSGADLSGANLGKANLSNANLVGANLTDAKLEDADLTGVDLTQALNVPRIGALREHYQIETPQSSAFTRWFGDSVVVGDDKKPVVVYHGTARGGFTQFDPSLRDSHHNAFYFTDSIAAAETYTDVQKPKTRHDPALEPDDPVGIYRLYIKLVNPMIVEGAGRKWDDLHDSRAPKLHKTYELAKWAQAKGYDGVIFKDIRDDGGRGVERAPPATVYAVFDPKAIKSATANNRNYDPNDADIRHNPRDRLSRRNPRLGKTWAELREDLREIGHGVLGEQILSTTLKTCSSTAPAVMQYLLERGHIVAPGGQDRPSGYTNHYDLAVLTSDRGWLNVDPTFMQFHCKHQPSEDEDEDEDWSDLAELKRHLQAAWADPMVTYRIDPLPWPPTPRGEVKVQAPPVLSKVGSWADYWKKYKHYAASAVDKARRQAAGEDVGRFKPLPYASLVVSFDPNDADIRHNPRRLPRAPRQR